MTWLEIKSEVIENCKKAGITDKAFIKNILVIERRVLTAKNMVSKISWDAMCNSSAYNQAARALELMNGGSRDSYNELGEWRGYGEEPKFGRMYAQYCKATGMCFDANLGDWLA